MAFYDIYIDRMMTSWLIFLHECFSVLNHLCFINFCALQLEPMLRPKRPVLQQFLAFNDMQSWLNCIDVFWSFDNSVTHTSITLFSQFSSECESKTTEKWSKMLFFGILKMIFAIWNDIIWWRVYLGTGRDEFQCRFIIVWSISD